MSSTFAVLVARDLRLAARRRVDVVLPIAFFTVAVSLSLGVGPEPQILRQIRPVSSGSPLSSRRCSR
jgi:heme exporter protein B